MYLLFRISMNISEWISAPPHLLKVSEGIWVAKVTGKHDWHVEGAPRNTASCNAQDSPRNTQCSYLKFTRVTAVEKHRKGNLILLSLKIQTF